MLVTHGAVVRQLGSAQFRMTETTHAPRCALPLHSHERAALTLVLSGLLTETFESRQWTCERLGLFFKPAGLPHANRYGPDGARSFIVEFDDPVVESPIGPDDFTHLLVPLALAAREAFSHPASTGLAADELVHELIARASRVRESGSKPCWVDRVTERLRAAMTDPPGLASLGEEAGVHPVHVSRAFRRHHGITMTRYVSRCRIAEGVRRLSRGASIPATALELGYFDQSHFTTAFRRETGLTPAAWQRLSSR